MTRGEIYRTAARLPERGDKPGFYVVVSRRFIAQNDDLSTVICAPVYGRILGSPPRSSSDRKRAFRARQRCGTTS